jgi:hypothetical protein
MMDQLHKSKDSFSQFVKEATGESYYLYHLFQPSLQIKSTLCGFNWEAPWPFLSSSPDGEAIKCHVWEQLSLPFLLGACINYLRDYSCNSSTNHVVSINANHPITLIHHPLFSFASLLLACGLEESQH